MGCQLYCNTIVTEACLEGKIVLQYWLAGGWIVSQYKNCIVIEAGQCCIAIQSLGHDTALGRALAGVRGARRRAAGAGVQASARACWARRRGAGQAGDRRGRTTDARASGKRPVGGAQARGARGRQALGAQGARGVGARASLGLCTRCTRLIFDPF